MENQKCRYIRRFLSGEVLPNTKYFWPQTAHTGDEEQNEQGRLGQRMAARGDGLEVIYVSLLYAGVVQLHTCHYYQRITCEGWG